MARWTQTRDAALHTEHKRWGCNVPAVDIDHLVVEYGHCRPKALIEYKHENVKEIKWHGPSFKALVELGNAARLPVFVVKYADDFTWWKVAGLNDRGKEMIDGVYQDMDKKEFVVFLYKLRGVEPPGYLWKKLGLDTRAKV